MFYNLENVLSHCRQFKDLGAYKLYYGLKPQGQILDETPADANLTNEEAVQRLQSVMQSISGGEFCLQLKPKLNSNREVITVLMRLPYSGATYGAPQGAIGATGNFNAANGQYIGIGQVNQLLQAERDKMTAEFRLQLLELERKRDREEFQKQLEELRTEKSGMLDHLLNSDFGKIAGAALAQKLLGGAGVPAVAGNTTQIITDMPPQGQGQQTPLTTENQNPETMMDDNAKLMWAIDTLAPVTGGNTETVQLLCKLAQWCTDNKGSMVYNMLTSELNKVEPKFPNNG